MFNPFVCILVLSAFTDKFAFFLLFTTFCLISLFCLLSPHGMILPLSCLLTPCAAPCCPATLPLMHNGYEGHHHLHFPQDPVP
jgi:hypothetical protein